MGAQGKRDGMSIEAMLPCFKCGKTLPNVCCDEENQPYGGTEFRTYGHYGSTFWDSMDGEELVINVCDECLREHGARLGQHKRYLPITANRLLVGKQWVDRPMVAYTGNRDDGHVELDADEIGSDLPNVEWPPNVAELKQYAMDRAVSS